MRTDPLSMVADAALDFPDCLTEFHRGVVSGWRAAIDELEDRCRDLNQADAAHLRDAVLWLEQKVETYRKSAERALQGGEGR